MTEQLNLLGIPARPEDELLGVGQRAVMEFLREHGSISRDEAGMLAHSRRGKHGVDELCAWCGTDGALLLGSLLKRGLVEKAADGAVRLPAVLEPDSDSGAFGEFPEGF